MQEYKIEIEEILQRVVKVEAEDREEALRKVEEKYKNEKTILDAEDFKEANFK